MKNIKGIENKLADDLSSHGHALMGLYVNSINIDFID